MHNVSHLQNKYCQKHGSHFDLIFCSCSHSKETSDSAKMRVCMWSVLNCCLVFSNSDSGDNLTGLNQ